MSIISNEILDKLPNHLKQFIVPQDYEEYTAIDQALWRYVMRKNINYLPKVAHESYTNGLAQTGISVDKIPNMYGMNRILKEIGWAAVAVDGFIPPSAFMEFQAYNVLVIAADIRQIDHIEYTPAPDIVHEAAGHAPIIANPEYAEYLRRFGEIGAKAISSAKDYELYEAVRHLSILKESHATTAQEIQEAEQVLEDVQANMGKPSEMARIRNLHWWTVEYGLIGDLNQPKIYGAGLLSSIGESKSCLEPEVEKRPYDISAAYQDFDITKKQPYLYVTPDFAHLSFVLEEFANKMALRTGGTKGLAKLLNSKELGTIEYNTGLQVSGILTEVITNKENNQPIYIKTTGETALSYRDKTLMSHGIDVHSHGFGSPIGKLKNINIAIEKMSPFDLAAYKISEGEFVKLSFEGGVVVEGKVITGTRNRYGKILLISFDQCTVTYGDTVLFDPSWGRYDMAVGTEITSVYGGVADPNAFDLVTHVPEEKTHKKAMTPEYRALNNLYKKLDNNLKQDELLNLLAEVKENHPKDWLLSVELLEISSANNLDQTEIILHLEQLQEKRPSVSHLIQEGIERVNFKKEA